MAFTKPEHEYYAKLYDSQKEKSQNFLKVLTIVIGFTLLFFFLILLPYVALQKKDVAATAALENVTDKIKKNEEEYNKFFGVQNSITNLKEEIGNSTEVLTQYIEKVSTASQAIQEPLEIFRSCSNLDNNRLEFIRCNVNEKALSLIKGYNNTIFKNVIDPLKENATQLIDSASLKQKTLSLMDSFKKITLSLNLSESVSAKVTAADEQRKQLDEYWAEFGSTIGNEINRLNSALDELKQTKISLEIDKREVGSAKSNITHRLDEVEFPLGKIPITINEAISLFPFGIIAGFIVCSILLSQATRLRKRYHLDYVRKYDISHLRTGMMISEELPIWIDPVSRKYVQILKSVVILILFIIFLISWSLILESWNLNSSNVAESILFGDRETNQLIFKISNYIVLLLFFCSYFIVVYEWGRYENQYQKVKNRNPNA